MLYELKDEKLQELSCKMKYYIKEKYKDEIGNVPEHIVDVLCQNYIIDCKNGDVDIDKLFDKYNICIE
tara:strand:+ start:385 stop:588 length:204 start_codon:yes stop_codon:yes gene_type:complete